MPDATCSIDGCDKPHHARGWCKMHLTRWERHGDPGEAAPRFIRGGVKPPCSIEGCEAPTDSRGWCSKHYQRWQKFGDPLAEVANRGALPRWKVDPETGCWIWQLAIDSNGYGKAGAVVPGGKKMWAHRWSYERHVGPIPPGLHLDHLCRTPACVNPAHLEPVTPAENAYRGEAPNMVRHRLGVCKNGHPYAEHAMFHKDKVCVDGSPSVAYCNTCRNERRRKTA